MRGLKIERWKQVWAMDISYIPLETGFMFLAFIIGLHSRYLVKWSLSNTMGSEWCTVVLKEAIKNYGVSEIFNSDQGSQFTSEVYITTLIDNCILISMDRIERALDNIFYRTIIAVSQI